MKRETAKRLVGMLRSEGRRLHARRADLAPELAVRGPFRAALFDVYGTMFISAAGGPVSGGAANGGPYAAALQRAGVAVRSPEAGAEAAADLARRIAGAHRRLRARGVDHPEIDIRILWRGVLRDLARRGHIGIPSGADAAERVAVAFEMRANPVWPMPGIGGALAAARAAGLRLGIVSNAQFYTPLLLDAFADVFAWPGGWSRRLCIWSFREREAKPSARLFEQAALRLRKEYGIAPAETLYLGNDMRNDIAPAGRCGFRTVLFAGDRRSLRLHRDDPALAAIRPDACLTHWSQFPALLRGS